MLTSDAIAAILNGVDGERELTQIELKTLANHARLVTLSQETVDAGDVHAKLAALVDEANEIRAYRHAEDQIVADLAAIGIVVNQVDDLLKPGVGSAKAVPPLLIGLKQTGNLVLRIKVVKALGSPWSNQDAVAALFEEFARTPDSTDRTTGILRDLIPQSIEKIADDRWLDEMLGAIRNPKTADSRQFFVRALRKMSKRKVEVIPELLSYLSTSEGVLYIPAARLLGRWKVSAALPAVRELLTTVDQRAPYPAPGAMSHSFERSELRKAIAALEQKASK